MEELNKQKSISMRTVIVAIVVLVLVVAGASAVYFVMNKDEGTENNVVANNAANNVASVNTTTNTTQAREVPSGMKLFTNADYGFTALYPETWPVKTVTSTHKFGDAEGVSVGLSLYRPDIKKDSTECVINFVKKNTDQGITQFLDANFTRPSKTSWTTGRLNFAGGMEAVMLANFDDLGSIGDLVSVGPYFESPDKQYLVMPLYSQDKTTFLTDIFGGTSYTCDDFLNSVRWN